MVPRYQAMPVPDLLVLVKDNDLPRRSPVWNLAKPHLRRNGFRCSPMDPIWHCFVATTGVSVSPQTQQDIKWSQSPGKYDARRLHNLRRSFQALISLIANGMLHVYWGAKPADSSSGGVEQLLASFNQIPTEMWRNTETRADSSLEAMKRLLGVQGMIFGLQTVSCTVAKSPA